MTERVLGPTGGQRRRRLAFVLPFMALAALILVIAAAAGPVGTAAGFEDDDGNLAPAAPINFDWNGFAPTTWAGTAPFASTKEFSGWAFTGLADAEATTSDSAFAGGTKQDDACTNVNGAKAEQGRPQTRLCRDRAVGGDVFLELAWVRIPQNTTSPSAHIGFEFNQSRTVGGASGALVQRTRGHADRLRQAVRPMCRGSRFGGGSQAAPARSGATARRAGAPRSTSPRSGSPGPR